LALVGVGTASASSAGQLGDPTLLVGALPEAANIGYIPTAVPFDNPATLSKPTPAIPHVSPDCTVRPQTIVEIKRMRRSAARIAQMIQTEVVIMEKRKTYVEQMTSYLNDRIRELNKVKQELEQETRWIEMSNQRIQELSQKEKLIKMQDILACLNADQDRLMGAKNSQTQAIADLQAQTHSLQTSIQAITDNVKGLQTGAPVAPAKK
jgi:DNA integrity scanning protein DisA with diadenylate cyclase activity